MTDTEILNKRQDHILNFIGKKGSLSVSEIFADLREKSGRVSQITVKRDLKKLVKLNFLISKGAGRGVRYELSPYYVLFKPIDVDQYFKKEVDEREIQENFNFQIFAKIKSIFSEEEKIFLGKLNSEYQRKTAKLPKDVLKKEFERLIVELSWKSSRIEGNTYSLLETEQLIMEHREAKGHSKEEAIMILNHKKTLDYIRKYAKIYGTLSVKKIAEIHSLLIDGLGVSKNIRRMLVRITGTRFKPLNNEFQIKEALEKTCSLVNKLKDPFEKALIAMLLIAYIQPFVDGNKRTSRLIGNAVLLAYDCCPLSYRSIDEMEYKKAILLFYEQNNLAYFKKLFLEQFKFVVENYF